jgi:solute carrier family 25 iron transporter 28/37
MTVPFTATQFMAYESLSRVMNPRKEYDPISHCVAGGLAGAFAAGLTTPLDAIKTLLQTRGLSEQADIKKVRGLFNAAAIIKRQYGWGGFFRGLKPRIITTMPSTAICWFVAPREIYLPQTALLTCSRSSYEMAKAYFKRQRDAAADAYGAKVT